MTDAAELVKELRARAFGVSADNLRVLSYEAADLIEAQAAALAAKDAEIKELHTTVGRLLGEVFARSGIDHLNRTTAFRAPKELTK